MTEPARRLSSIDAGGPVLGFDVDWDRGRLVAIVDGDDGLLRLRLDGDALQRVGWLGESLVPPDGRAATNVLFHPSAGVAVSVGWERPIRVWSLDPLQPMHEMGDPSPPHSVRPRKGFWGAAWSASGRYLDTHNLALDRGQRFDWATGQHVADRWGHDGPFARHPAADFSTFALGAEASTLHFAIWEGFVAKWLPVAIDMFVPCKPAFAVGTLAAVGGTTQVHAIAYGFPSLQPRFAVKLDMVDEDVAGEFGVSQALAFSADAAILYVPGGDGEIVALDGRDGHELHRWRAHDGMITHLVHHPREGRLLSAGLDGRVALSATPGAVARAAVDDEVREFLRRHPPMAGDPEAMPRGSVTILDAPW